MFNYLLMMEKCVGIENMFAIRTCNLLCRRGDYIINWLIVEIVCFVKFIIWKMMGLCRDHMLILLKVRKR